ncbi:hypothetical protein D3273_08370 [Lichenibacterium minor]|jgi:hypothetical protein|uniref:DUF6894 domain-containing protein n=1 Tax=Lichenibacterium minor TaxID=2316528 RepID=A0A4Q2UBD4_9HYPH|nr:hypothetical protein [Lichenibacterium minor]RYC32396.1 hypothetical protein D3273_08370 [Lichenibacterium minor]
MPLYYIDLYDNEVLARDEFGLELDSLYEAREQAIALLPDMARHGLPDGDSHDYTAVVRCHEGRVRYEVTLSLRGGWVEAPAYPPPVHH